MFEDLQSSVVFPTFHESVESTKEESEKNESVKENKEENKENDDVSPPILYQSALLEPNDQKMIIIGNGFISKHLQKYHFPTFKIYSIDLSQKDFEETIKIIDPDVIIIACKTFIPTLLKKLHEKFHKLERVIESTKLCTNLKRVVFLLEERYNSAASNAISLLFEEIFNQAQSISSFIQYITIKSPIVISSPRHIIKEYQKIARDLSSDKFPMYVRGYLSSIVELETLTTTIERAIDKTNTTMRYVLEGNLFQLYDLCKIYSKEFNKGYISLSKNIKKEEEKRLLLTRYELRNLLINMMIL